MSRELRTIKFQMMMSPSEAKELDDWMFAHRLRSRAEAIRVLCRAAMSRPTVEVDEPYDPSDDYCPNCGGEGIVYSCFEEWACVDPESGCDMCERRCDWCRPSRKAEGQP